MAGRVDWRLRAVAWLDALTSKPADACTPDEWRAALRGSVRNAERLGLAGRRAPVESVEDRAIAGRPTRLYRPHRLEPDAKPPAVIYFHGGGWVAGDLDTHDGVCRALATEAKAVVIAVDYRRAPEHPFPAAVLDALAVTTAVAGGAGGADIDGARVAVAGDSAGGNLAAVTSLRLRGSTAELRAQLLVYPVIDCSAEAPSYQQFATGHLLTRATMRYYLRHYLPREEDRRSPDASPCFAALAGAPPAMVITAGADVLRDEGRAYADALAKAGVPVERLEASDMLHGFFNLQGLAASRAAMRTAGAWLAERLR